MTKTNRPNRWGANLFSLLSALMLTLMLSACNNNSTPAAVTVTGTAATGAAMDGFVFITDATGTEINVAINTNGSYSADVSGMTPPFLLRAVPSAGQTQFAFATGSGTVNITPLSTLATQIAAGSGNALDALLSNWSTSQLTATAFSNAQAVVNANLATQFSAQTLDGTAYDFMGTAFTANGTGFDALLDGLSVTVNPSNGQFNVAAANGGAAIPVNVNISVAGINIGVVGGTGGGSTGSCAGKAGAVNQWHLVICTETPAGIDTVDNGDVGTVIPDIALVKAKVSQFPNAQVTASVNTATKKVFIVTFTNTVAGFSIQTSMTYVFMLNTGSTGGTTATGGTGVGSLTITGDATNVTSPFVPSPAVAIVNADTASPVGQERFAEIAWGIGDFTAGTRFGVAINYHPVNGILINIRRNLVGQEINWSLQGAASAMGVTHDTANKTFTFTNVTTGAGQDLTGVTFSALVINGTLEYSGTVPASLVAFENL